MSDANIQTIKLIDTASFSNMFKPLYETDANCANSGISEAPTSERQADDSYAQGVIDGEQAAQVKFAKERAQLMTLISSAEALQPEASDELAMLIGEAVETLVKQIVGVFTPDAAWLESRIEKAVALIADCDAARTVWMHPDDIALLDDDTIKLLVIADETASRGSLRIDCSTGWIENSNALYLEELRSELGLKDDVS